MKRLTRLLLLVTAIGLFGYLLTVNLKPGFAVTDFLPADTIALVECEDFARTWEEWQRSSINNQLKAVDFIRIFEQLGLSDFPIVEFQAVTSALNRFAKTSFFSRFFTRKSVVALLPGSQQQAHDSAALLRHLVLIVELGPGVSLQHQLQQIFGSIRSSSVTVYQGVPMVTLTLQSGQVFTFSQYRRVLLCALEPELVQRCIDQSLNRMVQARTGLHLNQEYQELKKRAGVQADIFLYTDLEALMRQLPPTLIGETQETELLPHHCAIFHQKEAKHDRLSMVAQVRQEQLRAFTDRYQLAPPVEESLGKRISSETQVYFSTNWFHPKTLWHLGLQSCGPEIEELMSSVAQQVLENTGTTIDDFFDVFGSKFGVFINEQQVVPQTTQSMAGLYIEAYDQKKVDVMLKQMLAGLQMVTVVTGGTEIVSVIMAGGLLSPAYALMGNYLILADSVGLIEQVQRQGGLMSTNSDTTLGPVRDRENNFFLFVRTKSVAQRLISILTVLTKETADQARVLSSKTKQLIERVVIPVLSSLIGMETSSLRGYAAGDEMMLEMDFASSGKE